MHVHQKLKIWFCNRVSALPTQCAGKNICICFSVKGNRRQRPDRSIFLALWSVCKTLRAVWINIYDWNARRFSWKNFQTWGKKECPFFCAQISVTDSHGTSSEQTQLNIWSIKFCWPKSVGCWSRHHRLR